MARQTQQCESPGGREGLGGPGWGGPTVAHLAQGTGGDDIVHELHREPAAELNGLYMALASPWEGGEEETHGQGIVQVPQGVDERGIPARPGVGPRGLLQPGLRVGVPTSLNHPNSHLKALQPKPGLATTTF